MESKNNGDTNDNQPDQQDQKKINLPPVEEINTESPPKDIHPTDPVPPEDTEEKKESQPQLLSQPTEPKNDTLNDPSQEKKKDIVNIDNNDHISPIPSAPKSPLLSDDTHPNEVDDKEKKVDENNKDDNKEIKPSENTENKTENPEVNVVPSPGKGEGSDNESEKKKEEESQDGKKSEKSEKSETSNTGTQENQSQTAVNPTSVLPTEDGMSEEALNFLSTPFQAPMNTKKSRLGVILTNYNKIKENLFLLLTSTNKNIPQEVNTMLNYLDNLSEILDVIISMQKIPVKKKGINNSLNEKLNDLQEQNEVKLVNVYKKEYEKKLARLKQVSDEKYLKALREKQAKLENEIKCFENDNKQLKTNQQISENLFKKKISGDSIKEHLSKKMDEYEKYNRNIENLSKKIAKNLEEIKIYNVKLNELDERMKNLDRMAHETYRFIDYDNIKTLERKNRKRDNEIEKAKKQIEVYDKAFKSNKVKYETIIINNHNTLTQLEADKNELMELLQSKQSPKSSEENAEEIPTQIEFAPPQPKQDSVMPTTTNNDEKMRVLRELEKKQGEILHNVSVDNPPLNSSIVLKKIALKPNFSFSHGKMKGQNEIAEDIKIDKNIEKKPEPSTNSKDVKESMRAKVLNTAVIGEDDLVDHKMLRGIDDFRPEEKEDAQTNSNDHEHEQILPTDSEKEKPKKEKVDQGDQVVLNSKRSNTKDKEVDIDNDNKDDDEEAHQSKHSEDKMNVEPLETPGGDSKENSGVLNDKEKESKGSEGTKEDKEDKEGGEGKEDKEDKNKEGAPQGPGEGVKGLPKKKFQEESFDRQHLDDSYI